MYIIYVGLHSGGLTTLSPIDKTRGYWNKILTKKADSREVAGKGRKTDEEVVSKQFEKEPGWPPICEAGLR